MRFLKDDPAYREAYEQARKAKSDAESIVWKLVLVPVMLRIIADVFGGVL